MMPRVILFTLLGFLVASVESAALSAFGFDNIALHLVLGLVIYLAVHAGGFEGALGAALVGYALDLFGGTPTGLSVFLCVALFLGVRLVAQTVDVNPVVLVFVAAASEVFHGAGALVLLGLTGSLRTLDLGASASIIAAQSVIAGVVVLPMYALAGWADRRLGSDRSLDRQVWIG